MSPRRTLLAAAMTLVVGVLLSIATYSFVNDTTGACQWKYRPARVVWSKVDVPHRIQLALHMANTATPPYTVPMSDSATDDTRTWNDDVTIAGMHAGGKSWAKETQLAVAALLFALFGLFIVWWGRDRPSLWLGLFCAAYAPGLLGFYAPLPEWAMLAAWSVATALAFVAAYALYAMAEAFTLAAVPEHGVGHRVIIGVRVAMIAGLAVGLVATLVEMLSPIIAAQDAEAFVSWLRAAADYFAEIVVKAIGPVGMLAAAVWFSRDDALRRKNLVTLATVGAALSGVVISIVIEVRHGQSPYFDAPWFTLLAIPIGFIIAIRTYKVVDVQVVVKRILVVTAMTAIIGAVIAGTEVLAERLADPMVEHLAHGADKAHQSAELQQRAGWAVAIKFVVAFVIVMTFGRLHHLLDETFKRLIFARRDQALADLHAFASRRADRITTPERLIEHTVVLVREAVCADGVAFYELRESAYVLVRGEGRAFPSSVDIDDAALVAVRSEHERVALGELHGVPSGLGRDGFVFGLAVRGRIGGVLVVGARANATDGAYEDEELDAVSDVARGVADALFSLRATETAAFVRAVAAGWLNGDAAARRAAELSETEPEHDIPPAWRAAENGQRSASQASGATG